MNAANDQSADGLDRVGRAGQHYERTTKRLVDAELDLKLIGEQWESDPSEANRAEAFEACAKAVVLLEATIKAVDEYLAVAAGVLPQRELEVVGYGRAGWVKQVAPHLAMLRKLAPPAGLAGAAS